MNLSPTQILILAIVAPPALAVYMALLWRFRHDFTSGSRDTDVERRRKPWGWGER